ncbi:MAG: queuosine precursor transporter [Chitinophagales bacterium]|nr:queuosine precursor transporter [Chitinophagales bacterium]
MKYFEDKTNRLYIVMCAFFIANAMVAEFMGVKIFSLEETLNITKPVFSLLGVKFDGISLTCGVLLWPFVFVMTDIINEYFGVKGVRFISWIAAIMIAYSYLMLYAAMGTAPAGWWIGSSAYGSELDFNKAYIAVFGQGANIIVGSLTAFLIGQFIDVKVFHWVKKKTGEKWIWLRATGSTLVSQLIDSFVVLFIAFYLMKSGEQGQWSLNMVLAVGIVNYVYKLGAALLLTPFIYGIHYVVDAFLGKELAEKLRAQAIAGNVELR